MHASKTLMLNSLKYDSHTDEVRVTGPTDYPLISVSMYKPMMLLVPPNQEGELLLGRSILEGWSYRVEIVTADNPVRIDCPLWNTKAYRMTNNHLRFDYSEEEEMYYVRWRVRGSE